MRTIRENVVKNDEENAFTFCGKELNCNDLHSYCSFLLLQFLWNVLLRYKWNFVSNLSPTKLLTIIWLLNFNEKPLMIQKYLI